jgi:biotin operon repressor
MNQGWIKLHRKLETWEWYNDSHMVHLFLHFMMLANHEPCKWHGEVIARGQFITGLDSLSTTTGISKQTIRTCIERLKSTGEITNKSTNKYRIITIVKYDEYQQDDRKSTSKLTYGSTFNQHTTNIQLTANKNDNKEKNDKKEIEAPSQINQSFFSKGEEYQKRVEMMAQIPSEVLIPELDKFILYWTEPNKSGSRVRWEQENTFEIGRRLATWFGNIKNYQQKQRLQTKVIFS